ncbi:hypothetical protein K470DRAFT_265845 [Piedraia hortae CBS 480.64]|uniref:PWWP domain-containing protein n=1 Tax=Piedraia hortae CBS 480.64 TaxID=1314780 RepID=A0A6A7BTP7_9PEZI|nr:hypothetical protein K470DRAFT_265845 [Piedraia hortae CBS 480.64]
MSDDPSAPAQEAAADVTMTDASVSSPPKTSVDVAANSMELSVPAVDAAEPDKVATTQSSAEEPQTADAGLKKRRSTGGVPEHKNKKLNRKKSTATLQLHLDCSPGDYFWARLKGYPPWPAIICDEEMLPESLLASRPVTAARPDGTIRDDFKEGGKNAKERTFPVMFLHTNEFAWVSNPNLTPLDPEECRDKPKGKASKSLQAAWELAAEQHDLAYFKEVLAIWQKEKQEQAKEAAKAEANKKTPKGKAPDKSEPKSSSKKRKKEDSDEEKPKKTPKITKLNAPKAPGTTSAKKSTSKPKKVVTAPDQTAEDAKPAMTEEERQAARYKAILYIRHRLQKGFLSRDQAPQENEMPTMADYFTQLENHQNMEPEIIRNTKIHKVLKAVVKLASIPRDEEFQFKKRSANLLGIWNKRMETEGGEASKVDNDAATPVEDAKDKPVTQDDDAEAGADEAVNGTDAAVTEAVEESTIKFDEKATGNEDGVTKTVVESVSGPTEMEVGA